MTEFNTTPSRDCIREYISFSALKTKKQRVLQIAMYVSIGLIALSGIVAAILLGQPFLLLMTATAILLAAAIPLLTRFVLKDSVDRLFESLKQQETVNAAVSEINLLFLKNGLPAGFFEWSEITEIREGKTGFFLKTAKNSLLLLAKDSVVSGTYDEAAQVLRGKKEKLAEQGKLQQKEKADKGKRDK